MMGVMSVGKSIIQSNMSASGSGLFSKYLGTHGNGVGLMSNARGLARNHKDMRNADAVLAANPKGADKWQRHRQDAMARGDAAGVAQADSMLSQIGREKVANRALADNASAAVADNLKGMAMAPLRYMGATDMRGQSGRFMTAAARTGVAGGAYLGAATGVRALTGGGMTYNNQGQQDIAGIPFI